MIDTANISDSQTANRWFESNSLLTGCSAEASTSNDNFTTLYSSPTKNIYDYMDSDTGVQYLIYDGYNAGGMTIRYNADGTIMVTEHPEDN